jgi:hypothetical protein
VRCLWCFHSIDVVDTALPEGLSESLPLSGGLWFTTSNAECYSLCTSYRASRRWCPILVALIVVVGAIGSHMSKLPAAVADSFFVQPLTRPTTVVSWRVDGALVAEGRC